MSNIETFTGDILRFTTAGSVDDGKSTLIGRLLMESKSLCADQVETVTRQSERRGDPYLDLALFTDGLKAEREQKITIDVAYLYFSTSRRKFIIADCPGHIQYTRNMVTGASTAELAVVLVDARNGLVTQSKRHAFLSTLLNIPHLVVAVNKMDLVDYDQARYEEICEDFREFSQRLQVKGVTFIPISALHGDNVVEKSTKMPWYKGTTLLHHLETVNVGAVRNRIDFRFPVQYVVRPNQDFRGFTGRIASGRVQENDEIVVLPSGKTSEVKEIWKGEERVSESVVGESVLLRLADEIDISRGDLIVRKNNLPRRAQNIDATICWLSEDEYVVSRQYVFKWTTRELQAQVSRLDYHIDVDTMHRSQATGFEVNDIGRVQLRLSEPIYFDTYLRNRQTGAFILIDPMSNNTVAAGTIRGVTPDLNRIVSVGSESESDRNLHEVERLVTTSQREQKNEHKGLVVWLTGLSGSGKSTVGVRVEKQLFEEGVQVGFLDGDTMRKGLCRDLDFTERAREENLRRVAEVAQIMMSQGQVVVAAFIGPLRKYRDEARKIVGSDRFLEIFVDCPVDECRKRDPKGLYQKADSGEIPHFTGVSAPYERPLKPDLLLDTQEMSIDDCVDLLMNEIRDRIKLDS